MQLTIDEAIDPNTCFEFRCPKWMTIWDRGYSGLDKHLENNTPENLEQEYSSDKSHLICYCITGPYTHSGMQRIK